MKAATIETSGRTSRAVQAASETAGGEGEGGFDLERGDAIAEGLDDVVVAACVGDVTVLVHDAEIATQEPVAAVDVDLFAFALPVAEHQARSERWMAMTPSAPGGRGSVPPSMGRMAMRRPSCGLPVVPALRGTAGLDDR